MSWPSSFCSTSFALHNYQGGHPSDEVSPAKQFVCTQAGCNRQFTRKEHLNRHLKSHSPHPRYACHICHKKFVRSDVLKRHVEKHPQPSTVRRTPVACTACHERKLRCDSNTPCQSCIRNSCQCVRHEHGLTSNAHPQTTAGEEEEEVAVTATPDSALDSAPLATVSPANPAGGNILVATAADSSQSWKALSVEPWYDTAFTSAEPTIMAAYSNNVSYGMPWTADENMYSDSNPSNLLPEYEPLVGMHSSNSHAGSEMGISSHSMQSSMSTATSSSSSVLSPHSVTFLPPASSTTTHGDASPKFEECLDTTSPTMKQYIQTYFAHVHPHWPILHEPTFEMSKVTPNLRAAMIVLASYYEGNDHHRQIARILFEAVLAAHLEPDPSLQNMQALALCVVYTLQQLTVENMLAKALHLSSVLTSTCRYRGVFNGKFDCRDPKDDQPVTFWLLQEQVRRLAYAVLQVDVYLSLLADHPPSVRYQEMTIPLPKSPDLWAAVTPQQRRQLQWKEPGGREKDMFSTIMRDALDVQQRDHSPRQLSAADYHLMLCALQAGSWDAAREAHSAASDELVAKQAPGSPIETWRAHLNTWRSNAEDECHLRRTYFASHVGSPDQLSAPLSLILWHTSALKMHAPLDLLQRTGCHNKREHYNTASGRQLNSHLQGWLASSCPRVAVWNAAQIIRIVVHELQQPPDPGRLRLNPLGFPSLLLSAIVVCAFAKYTRACPVCSTAFGCQPINLFEADDEGDALVEWKSTGKGVASLGSLGMICQCQTAKLVAFFTQYLSTDEQLERELAAFTNHLS